MVRGRSAPGGESSGRGHSPSRTVGDAHLLGALDGAGVERAVPRQPGQGPDRPLHRLRPADADGLRPGLPRGRRRSGQGGRPRGAPRPHGGADGSDPRRRDEHLNDHQRPRRLAAGSLRGPRRGQGRRGAPPGGDHAERHRQGVPEPGHLHLPPGPSLRLTIDTIAYTVRHAPRWNPINVCSYHLQEAGATPTQEVAYALATAIGVLDGVRHSGKIDPTELPGRGRPDQLLRQLRRPLRGGDLQDAGVHRHVGPHLCGALRRHRPQAPSFPLRGAGQLAGTDRAAAREQRAADRARVARRHPVGERPRPRPAAAGLERGTRPAPPLGPAVVAADSADPGVRDRPPRVRRHLRGLQGHRGQDGRPH